jgi:hypothetical protein
MKLALFRKLGQKKGSKGIEKERINILDGTAHAVANLQTLTNISLC